MSFSYHSCGYVHSRIGTDVSLIAILDSVTGGILYEFPIALPVEFHRVVKLSATERESVLCMWCCRCPPGTYSNVTGLGEYGWHWLRCPEHCFLCSHCTCGLFTISAKPLLRLCSVHFAVHGVPWRPVLLGRWADGAERAVQRGVLLLCGIGAPQRIGVRLARGGLRRCG